MEAAVYARNEAVVDSLANNKPLLEEAMIGPEAYQEFMADLAKQCPEGIPGGAMFRLKKAMSEELEFSSEAIISQSEEDMLKLYMSMFQPWFNLDGFKELGVLENPIFGAVQMALTATAKVGYAQCFSYIVEHAPAHVYDVDALDMLVALREQHKYILEAMWLNIDHEKYGFEGKLSMMIHPRIRDEFLHAKNSWMSPILADKMLDFKVLQ